MSIDVGLPVATDRRVSTVSVNGANLAVEERGSGDESIVFAHGVLLNHRIFDHQLEALKDRYRCIAFDFRGHGDSEVTDDGYAVDELTEDAAALIQQLGSAPCHFVGHSLGSYVGLRLGVRHPELLRSLILLSTSADPEGRSDVIRYRLLQAIARRFGIRPLVPKLMGVMFGQTFMRDPDRAVEREIWRRSIAAQDLAGGLLAVDGVLERSGVRGDLAKIMAPTLIVVGDQDATAPLRLGERIKDAIAGSQLVTVPAGHTSPVEQPDAVTAAIEQFLATNRARAAA
jgi:pimeloyl-ACP methyl ester carboxylesterase